MDRDTNNIRHKTRNEDTQNENIDIEN